MFRHVGFFCSWRQKMFVTKGEEPRAGTVPVGKKASPHLSEKGIEMKRFLGFVLVAALGMFTIGCEGDKGTTQNKTQTTTTQTKDGKTTGETTTTNDTKTKSTTPATGGMTTEKTTEKTTESTK